MGELVLLLGATTCAIVAVVLLTRGRIAEAIAAALTIVAVLLLVASHMVRPALAHDAPPTPALASGWTYPAECCSDHDCEALAEGDIVRRDGGSLITLTGEFLADGDSRIRLSPDGRPHGCWLGGRPGPRSLCAFVTPGGS